MKITIVGLSAVATSLALALQSAHEAMDLTGHDADPERATRAKALGAIDRSEWNLPAACEKSGLIVLDVPLAELPRTLTAIGESAPPDAVIIDLLPIKRPVLELVAASLAQPERFVGGHLLCARGAPGSTPAVDDIRGAPFYLVASPITSTAALDVATNLVVAAGAVPRYIDVEEHDGLAAATCQLPALLAAATVAALESEAGRKERNEAIGRTVGAMASTLGEHPDAAVFLGNGENLLYWIDRYVVELRRLRGLIADSELAALTELLGTAAATATRWTQRDTGGEPAPADRGDSGLRGLFLGGLGKRRSPR